MAQSKQSRARRTEWQSAKTRRATLVHAAPGAAADYARRALGLLQDISPFIFDIDRDHKLLFLSFFLPWTPQSLLS